MFNDAALVTESANLRKFALRLTRNKANAEDLLQMTLLRALEKRDMFETGTNLFRWTSKIMFNLFVSEYRRKMRFETQYSPDPYIERLSIQPQQETIVDLKTVHRAMESLSDKHQEILSLICIQGLSYEEVAAQLEIPIGTVRSRLSRARETLQLMLDDAPASVQVPFAPDQRQIGHHA
ncbi:MAG: sigma-70 family RNA polymerase sigma factor [Alphaproteobacteria bacterium]